MAAEKLAELWRGELLESVHHGHAVIHDGAGIVAAWGDPEQVIYPRSSVKMIQALPLIESGAAEDHRLTERQLALACASHNGAAIHTSAVADWLAAMQMDEGALRCGAHEPRDRDARQALAQSGAAPCQFHNNCSGKHAGFLTLNTRLKGDADYIAPDHPVQRAARAAFEEVTEMESPDWGIDGCSAPNFATRLDALARAMAFFARARDTGPRREAAAARLRAAMMAHPEMVAGEGRACTRLMRAMGGRAAVKTGAEGVFTAILPEQGLGIALKVSDGATRAAECAIAALLVRQGVLDAESDVARDLMHGRITSFRGFDAGFIRPAEALTA